MRIDGDIIEFFKRKAISPNSAPYQTQINNALRHYMENVTDEPALGDLANNAGFIKAVAEQVKRLIG